MNEVLIKNWNQRVKQEDIIFHVGDFCLSGKTGILVPGGRKNISSLKVGDKVYSVNTRGKPGEGGQNKAIYYESLLNGKIIFVRGNHDRQNSCKTIIESMDLYYFKENIHVVHNPTHAKPGMLNLVGHVHGAWKSMIINEDTFLINIGCDVWKYFPITFEEVFKYYAGMKNGSIETIRVRRPYSG